MDPRLPYVAEDHFYIDKNLNLLVLFSGAIFNTHALLESVKIKKEEIRVPELVSILYQEYGENFVSGINGDFSIFIYDQGRALTYIYRDHLGIRPISYCSESDSLYFSSDNLSLSKALYGDEEINKEFFDKLMISHTISASGLTEEFGITPNKKVKKIPPGCYIKFEKGGVALKKYWIPEKIKENRNLTFYDAVNDLRILIEDSVRIRSDAKFKASAHLSGGLDSYLVASISRKAYIKQSEFFGYCWSPQSYDPQTKSHDERELVGESAASLKIEPVYTKLDSSDIIKHLMNWKNLTDLFYEVKVLEHANANAINLIFSGWGGDEFISSGEIGVDSDLFFGLHWRSFLKRNPLTRPHQLLRVLIQGVILPALSLRFYSLSKFPAGDIKYLNKEYSVSSKTLNDFYSWRSRREILLKFIYQFHIAERAENWYYAGISNGVEYRYPLLDKRIIEYVLSIPSTALTTGLQNRKLIREILRGVAPERVRTNPSKNDPVRLDYFYVLINKACKEIAKELDSLEQDQVLKMIDFGKLRKSIDNFNSAESKVSFAEEFSILIFAKKAHEFARIYQGLRK
ncbi:MAG TPA: asparagine synthase-related protein [Desulfobacteraceae bacterium]|nr:asparagine synthase-related protein [Desulfobacteraceae bacterium]